MQKSKVVWQNGEFLPWESATVSSFSHGLQRGASVFDVGAFAIGPSGFHLFRGRDHVVRFLASAEAIGLSIVHSVDELQQAARQLASRSGHESGLIRWTAAVGDIQPDVVPTDARATVSIVAYAPRDLWLEGMLPKRPDVYAVQIAPHVRKAPPEVMPPHVKVSASYLGPMLARREALAAGFNEVLLCSVGGYILEAPTANVFWVKSGVLYTPPAREVLRGITRDSVLALVSSLGLRCEEVKAEPQVLYDADEAFLTATSYPVMPIGRLDQTVLSDGVAGPVTTQLRDALMGIAAGEPSLFSSWCD